MTKNFYFKVKETGCNTQVINHNSLSADQAIEQCLPIILKVIRYMESKYDCKAGDLFQDFVQEGYLGVLDALDRFDSSCGTRFTTYAFPFILGNIYEAFTDELHHGRTHLSTDCYDPETEEYCGNIFDNTPADPIYNADYGFASKEQREECEWRLSRVPNARDREIVRLHYGLADGFEHSFEAIGLIFSISPERVRQCHDRAMNQLYMAVLKEKNHATPCLYCSKVA